MTRRLVGCLVTLVVLVCGLVGCGGGEPERQSFPLDQAELDRPETLGLAASGQPVKGLIVYFHGSDQTARVILEVYDRMADAARTGVPGLALLDPPPADLRQAHPIYREANHP